MNWKDSSSLNISMSRHDLRLQRLRAMIEFKAFEVYVFDAAGYLRYRYQHTRIHAKSLSVEDRETQKTREFFYWPWLPIQPRSLSIYRSSRFAAVFALLGAPIGMYAHVNKKT